MKKAVIFVAWVIVMGFLVNLIINPIGESSKGKVQASEVAYRIVEKEELSFSNVKRFIWSVVVDEEVSVTDLELISKEVIEDAKKGEEFNAIAIHFYDHDEYIGKGYTLGQAEYAPDGDWSKADTISTGNYKKMDYKFDLREKDWSIRLSQEEMDVYGVWQVIYMEKAEEVDLPDEDGVTAEVAEALDITSEEVKAIVHKQSNWMFSDKNK